MNLLSSLNTAACSWVHSPKTENKVLKRTLSPSWLGSLHHTQPSWLACFPFCSLKTWGWATGRQKAQVKWFLSEWFPIRFKFVVSKPQKSLPEKKAPIQEKMTCPPRLFRVLLCSYGCKHSTPRHAVLIVCAILGLHRQKNEGCHEGDDGERAWWQQMQYGQKMQHRVCRAFMPTQAGDNRTR